MSTFPPFVDLRALQSKIGSFGPNSPLRRHVQRALTAQSCVADLSQARDYLALLHRLGTATQPPEAAAPMMIETAMIVQVILLYCRATGGNNARGERGSMTIIEQLTPAQKEDHKNVLQVRNRALVHVYSNEALADDVLWHSDVIFAVLADESWAAGVASHRIQFSPSLVARLDRLVPVAWDLLYHRFQDRMGQLTDFVNAATIDREDWVASFFDPVKRFGSEKAVQSVLDGMGKGLASFYTRD